MGFCFQRNEPVARAIQRLGCERLQRARQLLRNCSGPEAIHGARKEIKRARAVLELAQPIARKKEFRGVKKPLRKAAAHLSKPRDATVRAKTLRDLTRRFKRELPRGSFRDQRMALRKKSEREIQKFIDERTEVDRLLRRAAKRFRELKIKTDGWNAVAPGFKAIYRSARNAHHRALQTHSSTDFHEWRKHAKALWCQLKLLEPIWPEQMDHLTRDLETVGELLGEDHDLCILRDTLRKSRSNGADLNRLNALITKRQSQLRAQAIAAARNLHLEKPADFCERVGAYWRAWEASTPE